MTISPKISVDGKSIEMNTFCFPEMSLSSAKSRMKRHEFDFCISAKEVAETMLNDYEEWVKESREDDEQCGSPQDKLAEAGYPPLPDLLKNEELTELVFGNYLNRELFENFTWSGSGEIEYWFDQITKCNISHDTIQFRGICYSRIDKD
jgi:hypothetical protein